MPRTTLVFGKTSDGRHVLDVEGDVETVVGTLRNGWAQLNVARQGQEPSWVWVNESRVLYVEPVGESVYESASF